MRTPSHPGGEPTLLQRDLLLAPTCITSSDLFQQGAIQRSWHQGFVVSLGRDTTQRTHLLLVEGLVGGLPADGCRPLYLWFGMGVCPPHGAPPTPSSPLTAVLLPVDHRQLPSEGWAFLLQLLWNLRLRGDLEHRWRSQDGGPPRPQLQVEEVQEPGLGRCSWIREGRVPLDSSTGPSLKLQRDQPGTETRGGLGGTGSVMIKSRSVPRQAGLSPHGGQSTSRGTPPQGDLRRGRGSSEGTGQTQGWVVGQGGQGKLLPSKEGTEPAPEQRDREGNHAGVWGKELQVQRPRDLSLAGPSRAVRLGVHGARTLSFSPLPVASRGLSLVFGITPPARTAPGWGRSGGWQPTAGKGQGRCGPSRLAIRPPPLLLTNHGCLMKYLAP